MLSMLNVVQPIKNTQLQSISKILVRPTLNLLLANPHTESYIDKLEGGSTTTV
jgi:hypothetical protein